MVFNMKITNRYSSSLGIRGLNLNPGDNVVDDETWIDVSDNAVVKAWIKNGVLIEANDDQPETGINEQGSSGSDTESREKSKKTTK